MAEAAKAILGSAGHSAEVKVLYDDQALQPGAACAVFADLSGGSRLGADRAGAPRRRSEAIGAHVARQLLHELRAGATLDCYAGDQIIPFASLASGQSVFRVPKITEHIATGAWLARELLGSEVKAQNQLVIIEGVGFHKGKRESVTKDTIAT
jgi:RNA 3'-terminal phosphate cyclase (ATP)